MLYFVFVAAASVQFILYIHMMFCRAVNPVRRQAVLISVRLTRRVVHGSFCLLWVAFVRVLSSFLIYSGECVHGGRQSRY